jgi:DNA-binding transcriptional LysR family regulator
MEFTSRQLRAFHLVAEHRNFARAAQALFITPSGLSVLIREFENQLGYRLFDRTTRQVQLTRHGANLLEATGRHLDALDVKRVAFFRSSLVQIRARRDGAAAGGDLRWSALEGENLIVLSPSSPHQQLVDRQPAKSHVTYEMSGVANLLDTQVALVEAGEGAAIVPSFGLALCHGRNVVASRLVDPVVSVEFLQITQRGRTLPEGADEFVAFLKTYFAGWAARAGVT